MSKLTPTESLILDCLAARYRLGENLWTFDSRLQPQMDRLNAAGLVTSMHGIIEKTIRASLTEDGKKAVISKSYTPPGTGKWRTLSKKVISLDHATRVVTKVQEARR